MERRVSLTVLVIQLLRPDPCKQIDQSDFRLRVACPMERSTASVVSAAKIDSFVFEEVERDRLVALSSHMHHVNAEVVVSIDVGAVSD